MNNKLIKTNTIWYKIKSFFKKIFIKKRDININKLQEESNLKQKSELFNNISVKEEIEENNRKKDLAEKLLYGEIGSSELTEEETDEMIEYFTEDIQKINNELERIRNHIISMKKELQESKM